VKYFDIQPSDRPIGTCQAEDMIKETTADWRCQWVYKKKDRRMYVPSGYKYDGASNRRPFWSASGIRPDGLIRAGSLSHDVAYRSAGGSKPEALAGCTITDQDGKNVTIDRKEADWVLREFMKAAGMSRLKYNRAYRVVRVFGRKHWGGPMPSLRKR